VILWNLISGEMTAKYLSIADHYLYRFDIKDVFEWNILA